MRKQPSVGEESLTDWLLYELGERLPWVRYRKFNRTEEARVSGADWDWWFISRAVSLGLRIQAKKLVAGTDHYPGLAYSNRHGMQVEKLRESSASDNLLPFYVLYYSAAPTAHPVLCRGKPDAGFQEGTFLAAADVLYRKFIAPGRTNVDAAPLLAESNPLSCILCCPMMHEADKKVRGIYHHLERYFPLAMQPLNEEARNANEQDRGLHHRPPAHILALLESTDTPFPDWWERDASSLRNTNALMLWDLRDFDAA
jgi:hypothetical protein